MYHNSETQDHPFCGSAVPCSLCVPASSRWIGSVTSSFRPLLIRNVPSCCLFPPVALCLLISHTSSLPSHSRSQVLSFMRSFSLIRILCSPRQAACLRHSLNSYVLSTYYGPDTFHTLFMTFMSYKWATRESLLLYQVYFIIVGIIRFDLQIKHVKINRRSVKHWARIWLQLAPKLAFKTMPGIFTCSVGFNGSL